jgi:adenosine deaminase
MAEPLIELHCHSDGLLDPAMLSALVTDGFDSSVSRAEFEAVWPVNSMDDWMERYSPLASRCLSPFAKRLPTYAAHVRNLVRQGVAHAELMVSGLLAGTDGGSAVERFRAVRETVDAAAGGLITVELVACIGRGPPERAASQTEQILRLAGQGLVVGVALAGNETACTVKSLAPSLDRLRDAGLGIEIHAGEQGGPESVWDALEHGRPDRIGHGVRAFDDERLVEAIRERGVHLEFCPTSNVRLGVVRELRDLPIARARELGISFSVNTDDPGPFACSLESEIALVEEAFSFTSEDRAAMLANTWRARFGQRAR